MRRGHCPLYDCPNFHFLFFFCVFALQCKIYIPLLLLLLCIRRSGRSGQSRVPAGGHCPLPASLYNFLFCFFLSFGCCYCCYCYFCYCVLGEVVEQRASWRALPSSCVPLQLSFSQPQPADQLWIYMLWHKLQRFSIYYKSFGLTCLSLMSQGRVQF